MLIDIEKVKERKYSDWEAFMEKLGYFEEKKPIQINTQFNTFLTNRQKED
ncbi:MAG: hypothetical protein KatS3mg091_550 [Patescibacteria group bacterium]|nr:MAG: hypothetical protein KatS3mg091_550 [Patescibacteria group bacterium]